MNLRIQTPSGFGATDRVLPASVQVLEWDTEYFGFPVGRVDTSSQRLGELMAAPGRRAGSPGCGSFTASRDDELSEDSPGLSAIRTEVG